MLDNRLFKTFKSDELHANHIQIWNKLIYFAWQPYQQRIEYGLDKTWNNLVIFFMCSVQCTEPELLPSSCRAN